MRVASGLINGYQFQQPFSLWLQEIFRQNRHFGSKDRKFYREAFYGYWKLGYFGNGLTTEQKLLAGLLRMNPDDSLLLSVIPDFFPNNSGMRSFNDIAITVGQDWDPYAPYNSQITSAVNLTKLNHWFGLQAPVWLKYNPIHKQELLAFLNAKSIEYIEYSINAIKTGAGNLEDAVTKGWCRVQDLGSQESLYAELFDHTGLVWDACCGGGGKSLLVSDLNPDVTLYISDNRSQMIHNALLRFSAEGKNIPFSCTADLSRSIKSLNFDDKIRISKPVFDTIICDVPCSGSGTWRRSPEMLCAFSVNELDTYAKKQRSIVGNALPFLKPGGKLIYLTCSIFKAENESNSGCFQRELGMKLISEDYCGGYNKDADFIYRAVFEK